MNLLSHLRPALYAAGLIAAFVLGIQVGNQSSPPPTATIATNAIKSQPVPKLGSVAVNNSLDQTRTEHASSVVRLANASPNSRLAVLIDYAAKLDATQTLGALRKLDLAADSPESKLARHVLVAHYAELDPLTALTYVDTLNGEERTTQQANALGSWASRDAVKAAAYFDDNVLTGGLVGDEEVSSAAVIAGEWAQRDATAAWNWVSSLSPDARGEAIKRVAGHLAATNPTAALQAVSSMPEAYERAEAMTPLAMQWAQNDPGKTAAWVSSLRDSSEQSNAAVGLVSGWMQSNPYAVSEWVSKLPQGSTRDVAIKTMIRAQAVRNDPEAATFWAATVQDPGLRSELVNEAVRRWQVHDPDAAQRWLVANGR